jgi:hypothetical protein
MFANEIDCQELIDKCDKVLARTDKRLALIDRLDGRLRPLERVAAGIRRKENLCRTPTETNQQDMHLLEESRAGKVLAFPRL